MCGIVGIVGGNTEQYKVLIPKMLNAIRHRGPDGYGEDYFSNCALGHVRLSIIDLDNGQQPMRVSSGQASIVFNGEIYGYKEIKQTLHGYPFQTNCDTEVLLALYGKYQENMMSSVPGMFAFAIWDETKQTLFCARDRFGEKPFYYAISSQGDFIFASEIKAILATGLIEPVLDYAQLNHFLSYSYIYPTKTIYQNIYTLPPAHCLSFKDGNIQIKRYWTLPQVDESIDEEEAVEQFKYLFSQSVRRQLVADVPVGAFLSGGLDSGSVVAVASEFVPKLTTVSFGFAGGVNELALAKTMAEKYQTNHIELTDINFDIAELMHVAQHFYDEPMADPASIPAYLIAKQARKHVKVVLTGDAGDELLGGYDFKYRTLTYMFDLKEKNIYWRKRLLDIYYTVFRGIRRFLQNNGWYSKDPSVRLSEPCYHDIFLRQMAFDWIKDKNFHVVDLMRTKNRVLSQPLIDGIVLEARKESNYYIDYGFIEDESALDNAVRLDLQEYLPGNGMRKTDRTTMAVGLESRTPFLDLDLVEFCLKLPFSMKLRNREEKYILRRAYQEKWTSPVRKSIKNGFASPIDIWMNRKNFMELEEEYLGEKKRKMFQILNYSKVQQIRKTRTQRFLIWELLVLSMWFEMHPCNM